jgi:SAM-dependent methyltransferase
MTTVDQEVFRTVYRGRQSALHHMAYMRMCKVLLAQEALRRAGVSLEGKRVFDYGFGAGTFFRTCPRSAQLSGVELDPENVHAVRGMLRARGYAQVDLEAISLDAWSEHRLLKAEYDLVQCSHVLEHLEAPATFLRVLRRCVAKDGLLLGLVPINELSDNPHHVHKVRRELIERWSRESGFEVTSYFEADEIGWGAQPLFVYDTGPRHVLAQAVSLTLGVPATLLGAQRWWKLNSLLGKSTGARTSQAVFLLAPSSADPR